MARELNLFADIDNGILVQSFVSTTQAPIPKFVLGDSIPINFRPLTRNWDSGANPWNDVSMTGKTVRIAIGNMGGDPTAGTFTLTYGANTTTALPYNASASDISTALNLLASIVSAGGVTVSMSSGSVIRINFVAVGVRTAITVDASSLSPASSADVIVSTVGTVSVRHSVVTRIETTPAAYAELTDDFDVADVDIVHIRTNDPDVAGEITTLEFSPVPHGGTYVLTFIASTVSTGAIPFDASASDIQAIIELIPDIGIGNVIVSGTFPKFTFSFASSLTSDTGLDAIIDGLTVPIGKSGNLNANTSGIIELLNGAASISSKLEIELYDTVDSTTWTVIQSDCYVSDDVIGNSPVTVAGGPVYVTSDQLTPLDWAAQGPPSGTSGQVLTSDGGDGFGTPVTLGTAATTAATSYAPARSILVGVGPHAAAIGGRYTLQNTSTVANVTDPTGTAAGQTYTVIPALGTFRFNASGTTHSASRVQVVRYYNGSAWSTLSPVISDTLTVGSNTWDGSILSGAQAFSSTTRPTSGATTGTLEASSASSLITKGDADFRYVKGRVRAYHSANQSFLTASGTQKVLFDTETYDTGSNFASSRFTATVAGYVRVSVALNTSTNTAGQTYVYIYKNGSAVAIGYYIPAGNGAATMQLNDLVYCGVNDYLEVYINTLVDRTIIGASNVSWVNFEVLP